MAQLPRPGWRRSNPPLLPGEPFPSAVHGRGVRAHPSLAQLGSRRTPIKESIAEEK